jgi:hypothetical protein
MMSRRHVRLKHIWKNTLWRMLQFDAKTHLSAVEMLHIAALQAALHQRQLEDRHHNSLCTCPVWMH